MPGIDVRPVEIERTRALRQAVLRPRDTVEELSRHEGAGAFAVGGFDAEDLVAVGFITPDGGPGAWRVRGMATVPQARGAGAGTAILEALLDHARAQSAARVWCNARTPALSLYERAGFAPASGEFEIDGIGPHYVMQRTL